MFARQAIAQVAVLTFAYITGVHLHAATNSRELAPRADSQVTTNKNITNGEIEKQGIADEDAAMQIALRPPKRTRPVIAVLGLNEGSETTDYLVPYGVLKHSGVADVFALAIRPGPITLMPAPQS